MTYWVELDSAPPVAFYRDPAVRASISGIDDRRGRLASLGAIRRPLSLPGLAAGENANLSIDLDNADGALTRLFAAEPPLRLPARLMSAEGLVFAGLVTDLSLGDVARLEIESGLVRPLSDTVPLRNTTAWGEFEAVRTLPVVYGTVTVTPIRYDAGGRLWVLADHPIAGVDAVRVDGEPVTAWTFRNGLDPTGQAVAFLEFTAAPAESAELAVDLRGRLHPTTGALLSRPDEILLDFLASVCGASVSAADLDDFRVECQGLALGGVIDDARQSIRAQVDTMLQSVVAAWSAGAAGVAARYPFSDSGEVPTRASFDLLNCDGLTARASHAGLANVVRVRYGKDWSTGAATAALQVENTESIRRFGRLEMEWTADWLHAERLAQALAESLLAWLAWPRWLIEWTAPRTDLVPGDWIEIDHPACPVTGRHRLTAVEIDPLRLQSTLAIEAAAQAEAVVYSIQYRRVTEAGDPRITEMGDTLILET